MSEAIGPARGVPVGTPLVGESTGCTAFGGPTAVDDDGGLSAQVGMKIQVAHRKRHA